MCIPLTPCGGMESIKKKKPKTNKLGYGGLKKNTGVFGVLLPFISFCVFCLLFFLFFKFFFSFLCKEYFTVPCGKLGSPYLGN